VPISLDKQTITVGAAVASAAFLLGLAFNYGGKSKSLDDLSLQVATLQGSVASLNKTYTDSDKAQAVSMGKFELTINHLTQTVDNLQTQVQMQAQAQADYQVAAGRRR
jgi:hypothetical protein